ncbi:MAG: dihydrodipicolinate synthase family protein, partial [Flavisolibacter sp.]|nr:dihydrodipicolinate synthase family protein [Flavisolibacter sp.]
PLTGNYQLDREAVEKMFSYFHEHQVMPFILGTTGEAPSLPLALKQEYIQLAGKLKRKGDLLYAGISSNCLGESLALADYCLDAGVDVLVATLPTYYMLTEREMYHYFEQLAESVRGLLVIYNIPATTHMSIPLHVVDDLSHHENIVGVKDSERNEERLSKALQLWSERTDFSHFLGWAAQSAEALLKGCDGLIPSTGNFYPGLYRELYEAAKKGNREKALEWQQLSDELGDLYQKGRTLGESLWALKVLMQEAGLCQPYVMPPLLTQNEEEANKLRRQWQQINSRESIKLF